MLRRFFLVCFVFSGAYDAHAEDINDAIQIKGASRDKIQNELVLRLTRKNEFRLVCETRFQVSFERDADHTGVKPLYQTNEPVEKFTFTIAEVGGGVQVATNVALVENGGTPLERHTFIKSGKQLQEARDVIGSINKEWNSAGVKARLPEKPATSIRPLVSFQRSYASKSPPAARKAAVKIASTRLGFSAKMSENEGLEITAVDPKTPAANAGLQPSDIVTDIDGEAVTTGEQLKVGRERLMNKKRGIVRVLRNGKTFVATLRLRD